MIKSIQHMIMRLFSVPTDNPQLVKAQFAVSSVVPFDLVLAGLMTFGLLGVLADGRGDTRVVHAGITAAVCGWVASIAGFFIVIYIGDALASSSTDGPVQEPGVGLFLVFVCSLAAMATALRCCFGKPSGMTVWDAAEPGRSRKKGNENEVQEVR